MNNIPEMIAEDLNFCNEKSTIAFFSVSSGEGTTTSIISTAAYLANSQAAPLLVVDANHFNPSIHRIFGEQKAPGFTDMLGESEPSIDGHIRKTSRNIDIMPLGGKEPDSFYRVGEIRLKSVLDVMKKKYKTILFDMCSVNRFQITDRVISLFDGVVLVLSCETTKWETAQYAKDKLEKAGADMVGAIMNKREYYIPNWLYDYV